MTETQKIIEAENSDLFDVLAYGAFTLQPLSPETRAATAKVQMRASFGEKQQAFVDFVLAQYVKEGVEELAPTSSRPCCGSNTTTPYLKRLLTLETRSGFGGCLWRSKNTYISQ